MIFHKLNSPSQNFEILIRILRFCASICGIDLLKENYQMNWVTYFIFFFLSVYYACMMWTIVVNYKDDWTIFLRATVTIGSSLQGVSKIYNYIKEKHVILNFYKLLINIYKDYESRGDKYRKALFASTEKTKNSLVSLMVIYIIGVLGMVALPMISYILTGNRSQVMEFQIPGLDLQTDFGYFGTFIIQTILVVSAGFGLYSGDLMAMMYLLQAFMFSYIFAAKIEYINDMVVDPENNKKASVTKAVKDVVKWHQMYSDYTSRFNELCHLMITVQIATSFISTIICLYLIIAGGWPGAYTYALIAFGSLYLYCILGTETEIANEKFTQDIYDIHWYNLSISQQKIVLQVLCNTQSPKTIDIAGVMPLSLSTALKLTKTVYSIAMFMIEFME
ncbi:odorant receptor 67d-like [Cochliomyia hominivorax]